MRRRKTSELKTDGRSLSRADAERLLRGKRPEAEDLEHLASAVQALRGLGEQVPSESDTQAFAAEAAKLAAGSRTQGRSHAPAASGGTSRRRRRLRPALVGGLATLVLLLTASAGVAYASNDAAPGDTLYGLDLALEKIGLGDGGLQERLQEATKLCERGEVERGLNHAAEAVQNQAGLDADGEVNGALLHAATAIQTQNQGESTQVQAQVTELLQWMATTQSQGEELGQGVTERVRAITGETEQEQGEETEDGPGSGPNQSQSPNGEPKQR